MALPALIKPIDLKKEVRFSGEPASTTLARIFESFKDSFAIKNRWELLNKLKSLLFIYFILGLMVSSAQIDSILFQYLSKSYTLIPLWIINIINLVENNLSQKHEVMS